jgi:hypothetical protein
MKFNVAGVYGNLSSRYDFHLDRTCLTTTLHEDLRGFLCVYRLLSMGEKNVL